MDGPGTRTDCWMVKLLGYNGLAGILSRQIAAISCLRLKVLARGMACIKGNYSLTGRFWNSVLHGRLSRELLISRQPRRKKKTWEYGLSFLKFSIHIAYDVKKAHQILALIRSFIFLVNSWRQFDETIIFCHVRPLSEYRTVMLSGTSSVQKGFGIIVSNSASSNYDGSRFV